MSLSEIARETGLDRKTIRVAEELDITAKELAGLPRRFEVIPGAQV